MQYFMIYYFTLLEKKRGAGILPSLCQGPEIVRTSINEGKIGSCQSWKQICGQISGVYD